MRTIEADQVRAVVAQLQEWGHLPADYDAAGLVLELVRETGPRHNGGGPGQNRLGGFRSTDPATSRAAAQVNYPRSGTQRWKALVAIHQQGERGATASEIEFLTKVPFRSLTPRLGELKNGGWIVGTGRNRMGPMGAEQEVLILTSKAKERIRV